MPSYDCYDAPWDGKNEVKMLTKPDAKARLSATFDPFSLSRLLPSHPVELLPIQDSASRQNPLSERWAGIIRRLTRESWHVETIRPSSHYRA
jgi:hypothetical protein